MTTQTIDALIGDEEKNIKQKKEKERNREQVPNPATLDYSVASYDAQGSYGEPILFTSPPRPTGGHYIYIWGGGSLGSIVRGSEGLCLCYSCFT